MLLENETRITLNFEINNDIPLRQFIGDQLFKKLIIRTVELIGDQDRATCICLLDKIKESKRALETLIDLQMN
jgi:hypothetical protein